MTSRGGSTISERVGGGGGGEVEVKCGLQRKVYEEHGCVEIQSP